jgi:signal transduction histidine kinase/tetratricopeptide (TPR) repeat protein
MSKKIRITIIIAVIYSGSLWAHSDPYIDSLFNQLKKVDDTTRIDLFNELSQIYWQRSFDSSLLFASHALSLSEKTNDKFRIAYCLNMTGNAYYMLSNFTKSLDYYQKALTMREELGDSNDIAKTLNNIGAVHLNIHNQTEALDYFEKALKIYTGLGKDEIVFILMNNIGSLYIEQKEYEKALEYIQKAYEIAREINDEKSIIIALNNLGEISNSIERYDQALEYFVHAREKSEEQKDYNSLATILLNIGITYLKKDQPEQSLVFFNKSLEYAKAVNSIQTKRDVYKNLYDLYSSGNNPQKALEFIELYTEANDSISSEESRLKIKELELKYNAENFQNEIELLKKDNEIKNLRLNRLRIEVISLVIFLLLAGTIWFINSQRNRLKRETNKLLTQKNQELESTLRKLKESELSLKELNAAKDKFFSIIGHDLRNPLNALLGFSELISGSSRDFTLEEIRKYNKIINDSARNIHQLIENLLEWSRSQSGNIDFSPKHHNLLPITNGIQDISSIQLKKKNITVHNYIPEDLVVFADKNLLSTILRNLINNAIKFTPSGGYISLSAERSNGQVSISISDTGIGMTRDQLNNLFLLDNHLTKIGTSQETGTGLGLILCKEFVEIHKGSIKVESEPNKGSTFKFSLPDPK